MKRGFFLGWLIVLFFHSEAQDTLPRFTVTTLGGTRSVISWTNNYPVVTQISIQRSLDSTRNFKTIMTVPDPKVLQNGFVDAKAPTPFVFYRLFIVLESGNYLFTQSKRPFWDTAAAARKRIPPSSPTNGQRRVLISDRVHPEQAELLRDKLKEQTLAEEKLFVVKRNDSVITEFLEKDLKAFRDSIVYRTKDTLVFLSIDTIVLKPFVPREIYRPSQYVYTERDGNIAISLPDAMRKKYMIKFFEDDNTSLFEIKHVRDTMLILDKANFLHAGWFRFELYEEGKLKEKHRFFIPKDF